MPVESLPTESGVGNSPAGSSLTTAASAAGALGSEGEGGGDEEPDPPLSTAFTCTVTDAESVLPLPGPVPNNPFTFYSGGTAAAWELDFVGGLRRSVEAAEANLAAAVAEIEQVDPLDPRHPFCELSNSSVDSCWGCDIEYFPQC